MPHPRISTMFYTLTFFLSFTLHLPNVYPYAIISGDSTSFLVEGEQFFEKAKQKSQQLRVPLSFKAQLIGDGELLESKIFTYSNVLNSWKVEKNNSLIILVGTDDYLVMQRGQCKRVNDWVYEDPFSWIESASFVGIEDIRGQTCSVWSQGSSLKSRTAYIDISSGLPVRLRQLDPLLFTRSVWDFANLDTSISLAKEDFNPPAACLLPPPVCSQNSTGTAPISLDLYLAHTAPADRAEVLDLGDTNVADLRGDVSFLCFYLHNPDQFLSRPYTLVSRLRLRVWPQWGQYANCDRYPIRGKMCASGGDGFHVGRAAAFEQKWMSGQCLNNSDVGTWYSLPHAAECSIKNKIMGVNCTWIVEKRVKTIDLECLVQTHEFLEHCGIYSSTDPRGPPSTRSVENFQTAFILEDSKYGGCRDMSDWYYH